MFLPAFRREEDYSDQVHRLRWYLPENSGFSAALIGEREMALLPPASYFMDDRSEMPSNIRTLTSGNSDRASLDALLDRTRFVAYWDWQAKSEYSELVAAKGKRELMLDKNDASRREAFEYVRMFTDLEPYETRKQRVTEAAAKLNRLAEKLAGYEKAYVFGTGPSLEEAYRFSFSDGIRIVCNSIVKNEKLMDHIQPQVIVAADPLFHYGCSKYAAKFRGQLVDAIEKYDATFVYPFFYSGLVAFHYRNLADRSIPIPQERRETFNLDLRNGFMLRGMDNVLTLLMLPLGSTLAKKVGILGCDGRKPEETYFWQHHSASQYVDLMDGIKECHPGFFNHVVYEDYYDAHCANLEQLLLEGEQAGRSYFSMTRTYIPALVSRAIA